MQHAAPAELPWRAFGNESEDVSFLGPLEQEQRAGGERRVGSVETE
jgi:hypothetical protein